MAVMQSEYERGSVVRFKSRVLEFVKGARANKIKNSKGGAFEVVNLKGQYLVIQNGSETHTVSTSEITPCEPDVALLNWKLEKNEQAKELLIQMKEKLEGRIFWPDNRNSHFWYLNEYDRLCSTDGQYSAMRHRLLASGPTMAARLNRKTKLMYDMHWCADQANGDWQPNYTNDIHDIWYIRIDPETSELTIDAAKTGLSAHSVFNILYRSEDIAERMVEIFGEQIKSYY